MIRYLFAMILPVLALAQPPRSFFPWWESPMTRDMNLTDQQRQQIRTILREARGPMIDLRGAVEKAEAELEDLFNDESAGQQRTSEAVEKLVKARGDMTRAFAQLSLRLRGVLTTQQWQELQKRRPRPGVREGPRPMRGRQKRPDQQQP
jgi:Spy/CpxP family protein refolding chaperone